MSLPFKSVAIAATVVACCAFIPGVGAQTSTPPVVVNDDQIVAIVGEDRILLSEILSAKEALSEKYRDAPLDAIYSNLLDQVVERRLIAKASADEGLDKERNVALRLARARESVLLEAYISKHVQPQLMEEMLKERYQAQYANQGGEQEIHARHILLVSEADAMAVLQELEKGIEFAELAKQRSKGPSASRGGDLGFFRKQDMVPEFAEAAFALGEGEVSAPVKTQFGWHVIFLVARRSSAPPPFDQVAETLQREVARDAIVKIIADLRSKTNIQLFNSDGTPLVVPTVIRPAQ